MGATEVIHGVSGSTIAIIFGVYLEFIQSLKSVDRKAWQLLKQGSFSNFWAKINGSFLFSIIAGILVSLFTISKIVTLLLHHYFIISSSLLFGIILISSLLLLRKITTWRAATVLAFFSGILINYSLTIFAPLHLPDNFIFAILAGFLAGFSLAFPGISSAFILILIGKYQFIVTSFTHLNVGIICVFFIGCLLGLWVASRLMYRLLTDYYNTTIALLAGLMLGALNKLWPWRNVLEYATVSNGNQTPAYDESILPWKYVALTNKDPQVFLAILMIALGVFIVVLIEKIAAGLKTKI